MRAGRCSKERSSNRAPRGPAARRGRRGKTGRDSLDVVDISARDRWVPGPEVSSAHRRLRWPGSNGTHAGIRLGGVGPGPCTASAAGVVVRDPGRLQLDRAPRGVVHLTTVRRSRYHRYRSRSRPDQETDFSSCRRWTRSAEPGAGLAMAAVPGAGRRPGCSLSGVGGFRDIVLSLVAWPDCLPDTGR